MCMTISFIHSLLFLLVIQYSTRWSFSFCSFRYASTYTESCLSALLNADVRPDMVLGLIYVPIAAFGYEALQIMTVPGPI